MINPEREAYVKLYNKCYLVVDKDNLASIKNYLQMLSLINEPEEMNLKTMRRDLELWCITNKIKYELSRHPMPLEKYIWYHKKSQDKSEGNN